jgi:putative nucleotidyltransferase with HDIG domain
MNIIVVSDRPLPKGSIALKVPLFFSAGFCPMEKTAPDLLGKADLILVELQDAGGSSLEKFKTVLAGLSGSPVLCLISQFSRREVVQAKALGQVELFDRDEHWEKLIGKIRELSADKNKVSFSSATHVETKEAFMNASAAMDTVAQAAVSGDSLPVNALQKSANSICLTLVKYGLGEWLDTVQLHHSHTYTHSMMVAGLAGGFAQKLGWDAKDCEKITVAGLLHDVGKVKIPLAILDKPGRLTDKEMDLVRKHPVHSRDILDARAEVSEGVKEMAYSHHEFLDGSGYPKGLSGDQISMPVRLMTICDIYSALTEKRSYKKAFTPRNAYAELVAMGKKLDEQLLRAFRPVVLENGFCAVNREAGAAARTARSAAG